MCINKNWLGLIVLNSFSFINNNKIKCDVNIWFLENTGCGFPSRKLKIVNLSLNSVCTVEECHVCNKSESLLIAQLYTHIKYVCVINTETINT